MDERSKDKDLEHHREKPEGQPITSNQGVRVSDDQNSLKAGVRGPTLLEDTFFREKITHFDHERIPERVVHARGSGAHGYFQVYESLADLTCAKFLQDPKAKTPVFVRFSTVAGSRGSADTVRDVRGFATKFYTEDGVFDLVGNNIPVFFIQDAIKFPDVIHAAKPEPACEMPQAQTAHDSFWDFVSLTPESTHMLLWVMSDRAIPRSFRMMEGFGVNTYRLVNAEGKGRLVKFHWKPLLGLHSLVWDEAQKLAGKDPDFHRRDLWDTIDQGVFPEYEFGLQIMEEDDQLNFPFDPLDATKIWPEALFPVHRVGKMTLNRNPDKFFNETEQVAFCPTHMVPGIDFSNDPLLQGRLFSYIDTQLTRLGGPNFAELPINRPLAPVHNNQQDGFMRQTINTGTANYGPNSIGGGCPFQAGAAGGGFVSYAERVDGRKVRERSPSFADHFSQATLFWKSQSAAEQEHIVLAFRFELGKCIRKEIRQRTVDLLANVDMELSRRVARGLGVAAPTSLDEANGRLIADWQKYGTTGLPGAPQPLPVEQAPELSMLSSPKDSIATRRIAFLAADGVDAKQLEAMRQALTQAGAMVEVVAPLPAITAADGTMIEADRTLLTAPSVMYDALYVPGGAASVGVLRGDPDALQFVGETLRHCKAVAATGEGADLLLAATQAMVGSADGQADRLLASDPGVVLAQNQTGTASAAQQFIQAIAQHRNFARPLRQQVPA